MIDKTVVVIGGGAAGLIATGKLKDRVKNVILIEKNEQVGRKLRITGKGRCNITNIADTEEILNNITANKKFLYSSIYNFTNYDMISLINSLGVPTKVERGGRVFPESDKAKDVVDALDRYATGKNVKKIKDKVCDILISYNKVIGVKTVNKEITADSVILATGGMSYPLTGSTGDGYRIAEKLGHTIITPKPSLVPLVTKQKWVKDLMGLTLKNVVLTIYDENKKKLFSELGEMLFTHFGISGPLVLSASCHMRDKQKCLAEIDIKPALDIEMLNQRIIRDFEKYSKKHLINSLDELLPKALIPVIIEQAGINPHKDVSLITRNERMNIVNVIKSLKLDIVATRPIDEAIITAGGVKVSEINPSTMESKLVSGLYFAGEVIDVDAYTGGYNLQIAFSTGVLAGENA